MGLALIRHHTYLRARIAIALFAYVLVACAAPQAEPIVATGRAFADADRLFHADPRWLGGDAATSVPLSPGRTLWLFGDSFVARSNVHTRAAAAFVHNTIAIESGDDPRTASMAFAWGRDARGLPAPFFPDTRRNWYWPGSGVRIGEGPLVIFLEKIIATPGHGLGFVPDGYAVAVIANPDASPTRWRSRIVEEPAPPFDAVPGSAVIRDGDHVVVLAIRQRGVHAGALVRYRSNAFAGGDLSGAEWWAGETRGWVATARIGKGGPTFVIDDAGAECSLQWDVRLSVFVHVASYGFGASTIGVRTAPALIGPWSAPHTVYRPPESDRERPLVYAGKAHPELVGPDTRNSVVTYVANSFDPKDLLTPEGEQSLYWPHFVAVPLGEPGK